MNPTLSIRDLQIFAEAAISIADHLTETARREGDQLSWDMPKRDKRADELRYVAGDGFLYHGSAGISLFLLRLGSYLGDDDLLKTARLGLRHAVAVAESEPARGGFYSGTAGIAATCAEMATRTGEQHWLETARKLCLEIGAGITPARQLDLIAGEAGSLVGLLRVFEVTADRAILDAAVKLADFLIGERRAEPEGYSWDVLHPSVLGNPLGISHGAGGIGLAFLELARFSGDRRHLACGVEALRYEDSFLDRHGTWPDLRHQGLAAYVEEGRWQDLRRDVAAGTFDVDEAEPGEMAAWCHGAPGAGLARLRAHQLLALRHHGEAVERAAEATLRTVVDPVPGSYNHSICHGLCGNAEMLLEFARHTGQARYGEAAVATATRCLEEAERRRGHFLSGFADAAYAPGLMVGVAGIGHFFLRLIDPDLPSVLLPVAGPAECPELAAEAREMARRPPSLRRHFRRTEKLLSALGEAADTGVVMADPRATAADYQEALGERIDALEGPAGPALREVFSCEIEALDMLRRRPSPAAGLVTRLMRRPPEVLESPEIVIRLARSARLVYAEHDWTTGEPSAPACLLIARNKEGVEIRHLEDLAAMVYGLVVEPRPVGEVLDRMVEQIAATTDLETADAVAALRARLTGILQRSYDAGLLDIVEAAELTPCDIDGPLCTSCGECCRLKIYIPGDATYMEFLEVVLARPLSAIYPEIRLSLLEEADGQRQVEVDLGYCHHLERGTGGGEGAAFYRCKIYHQRPETCRRFNCASWWRQQRSVSTARSASDRLVEKVVALRRLGSAAPAGSSRR